MAKIKFNTVEILWRQQMFTNVKLIFTVFYASVNTYK